MKISNIFLLICCTSLLFSCKKDEKEKASNPVGYWTGLFANGSSTPQYDFAVLFRNNGTMRFYWTATDTATTPKAEGTYSVNGRTVISTYTYFTGLTGTFSSTATVNEADNNMTGTFGSGTNVSGQGNFVLSR